MDVDFLSESSVSLQNQNHIYNIYTQENLFGWIGVSYITSLFWLIHL